MFCVGVPEEGCAGLVLDAVLTLADEDEDEAEEEGKMRVVPITGVDMTEELGDELDSDPEPDGSDGDPAAALGVEAMDPPTVGVAPEDGVPLPVLPGATGGVVVAGPGPDEMVMFAIVNLPDLLPLSPKRTTMYESPAGTDGTVISVRPVMRRKPSARG